MASTTEHIFKPRTSIARKVGIVALSLIVAGLIVFVVVQFLGPSKEDLISTASEDMHEIENHDQSVLNGVVEGVISNYNFTQYGITKDQFCDMWLTDFAYSVDDARVEGSWGAVKVTLQVKPLRSILDTWQTDVVEYEQSPEGLAERPVAKTEKQADLLWTAIQKTPISTMPIELQYTIQNNHWAPGDGYVAVLTSTLVGLG